MSDADRHGVGDAGLVLGVTNLSKTYSSTVVDDVNLRVGRGRVHALLGGNGSGKSTVLKMLAGVVRPDPGGTITLGGVAHSSHDYTAHIAAAAGLRFVHQDLGLIDELSIAENFALGSSYPQAAPGWIDDRALLDLTSVELRRAGLQHDPRTLIGDLRPSDRSLVAIARALRGAEDGAGLTLVLDEPTASLPVHDVEHLLSALAGHREAGHSVIYVSHRLSEVTAIADDLTVLRDGRVAGSGPISDFTERRIVELIAGHDIVAAQHAAVASDADAAPLLAVRSLSAGPVTEVDLDLRAGEIVGVAGLVGSGRTSLLRALFGDLEGSGSVTLDGTPVRLRSTADAIAAGIALVPEDRLREAAYLERPVWENLSAAVLGRYRTWRGLRAEAERDAARSLVERYGIRTPSIDAPLGSLSGGNQQKVVLARWMQAEPKALLLDEPTQGVDAVARDEIHALIRTAAGAGACVLFVSSDVDELVQLADRIVILQRGRLTGELSGSQRRRDLITARIQQESGASA